MIEFLPYFLQIDRDWTHTHLVAPLFADNAEALILWPAVAHQTRFGEVLKVIGNAMTERATDLRLNRQTRQSLVFSLVVDHLHAYLEGRHPAVPRSKIQQMIRSLDDEVRSFAAEVMQRFVCDVSAPPPRTVQFLIRQKSSSDLLSLLFFKRFGLRSGRLQRPASAKRSLICQQPRTENSPVLFPQQNASSCRSTVGP